MPRTPEQQLKSFIAKFEPNEQLGLVLREAARAELTKTILGEINMP